MRRIVSASVVMMLLGLAPVTGLAAPVGPRPSAPTGPAITLVDGWWEQEHRDREAREEYWGLRQRQQARHNRLQAEIEALQRQRQDIDDCLARDIEEQHRLLRSDPR
jgi:hypothetical protein